MRVSPKKCTDCSLAQCELILSSTKYHPNPNVKSNETPNHLSPVPEQLGSNALSVPLALKQRLEHIVILLHIRLDSHLLILDAALDAALVRLLLA